MTERKYQPRGRCDDCGARIPLPSAKRCRSCHLAALEAAKARTAKVCEGCGSIFQKPPSASYAQWEKARFCGQSCSSRRKRRKPFDERFAASFCKGADDVCWLWNAGKTTAGYGTIHRDEDEVAVLAHRVSYEKHVGPIPEGLCRNPSCVNPAHLEPVTCAENIRRGRAARLNWDAVHEIRASTEKHTELAARFGVTPTAIIYVRSGKTWVAA